MMKTCPHGLCGDKELMTASFHECATCGRKACMNLGCTCSDYQVRHPIRRGIGERVMVQEADGWHATYPFANLEDIEVVENVSRQVSLQDYYEERRDAIS